MMKQLEGKQYKENLGDLLKTSAVRAGDLDHRALALLDHLQTRGRAKEACDLLKSTLQGASRDKIKNWRGYIYTLLRGFDQDAYSALKAEQAAMKAEQSTERRSKRGERRNSESAEEGDAEKRSSQKTTLALNQAASEFVPGKPWSGAGVSTPSTGGGRKGKKGFDSGAPEFVPGRTWGTGKSKSPKNANASFSKAAPEFVPGQVAWGGSGDAEAQAAQAHAHQAAVAAATTAASAILGLQMGATPFVPGRPWPQATFQQGASKKGPQDPSTPSKRRGSGGGAAAPKAKASPTGAGAQQRGRADGTNGASGRNAKAAKGGSAVAQAEVVAAPEPAKAAEPAAGEVVDTKGSDGTVPDDKPSTFPTKFVLLGLAATAAAAVVLISRRKRLAAT